MKLYEAKDIVRQHLSKTTFDTTLGDAALAHARREIEKLKNFWWMENVYTRSTVADTQTYHIILPPDSSTGGFELTAWKDFRKIYWKRSTETQWKELRFGGVKLEDADLRYGTTDEGSPELAVMDALDLHFFPIPDDAYDLKFYTYDWTTNPASNLSTDELLSYFPELLYTGALYWAYLVELKDVQGAATWKVLYDAEVKKIRQRGVRLDWADTMRLTPRTGSNQGIDRFQPYESNYND